MKELADKGVYTVATEPMVSGDWLAAALDDSGVVPVDVRPPHFYAQAHLPGAVNLPVFLLQGPDGGPPPEEAVAQRLGQLGISRATHVVAYDDGASPSAAVLYLLLSYYRHPAISVLDGGITKWRHDGRDWEYSSTAPTPVEYRMAGTDPAILASIQDVRAALDDPAVAIVDTRSPAEYLGLQMSAARNGHIPGAINVEWSNGLVQSEDAIAQARPASELRDIYAAAGITPDKTVIAYCQSGSRSSHTVLALKSLGYPDVRNYAAGWQEWGNRHDTPVDEG